ncbi:MAG: hypothetical protein H6Q21_1510 [Bacteroidetes bacterium]|nr:hypothetical protein [Bacteroidota bacterium]
MIHITGPGKEDHLNFGNFPCFSTFISIENETNAFRFQRFNYGYSLG